MHIFSVIIQSRDIINMDVALAVLSVAINYFMNMLTNIAEYAKV